MGRDDTVMHGIRAERKRLDPVRNVADIGVGYHQVQRHELRGHIKRSLSVRG